MRYITFIAAACTIFLAGSQKLVAQVANEDCIIVDQLDKMHAIQLRLYRDPATALFTNDIRQLRQMSTQLSNREVIAIVGGTSISGRGATFGRFLDDTRLLLQQTSLDDPFSSRAHFTSQVRGRLARIETHLQELRCDPEQIAIATREQSERQFSGIDAEDEEDDLQDVIETLTAYRDQVLQPRNFIILLLVSGTASVMTPLIQRWMVLRKRRAKRHNTSFATTYLMNDQTLPGALLDINCYGTKLKHGLDDPPEVGTNVEIEIFDGTSTGQVRWANAHYIGVQFDRQISLKTVAAIVAPPTESKTAPA